jgi:hypothetical protein
VLRGDRVPRNQIRGRLCYPGIWTLSLGLNDKMRKCASAAHQEKVGAMLNRAVNAVELGAPPADEAAKAFVMAAIARGVEAGHAAITRLESGVLELRFATGELFHLSDKGITRIV